MSCCAECARWEEQIPGLGLGRPLRRGLGDAVTDLASFNAALLAADALWAADQAGGQYTDSIQAYQTAGSTYAQLLDPQVNASASALVTQADAANTSLQAINNQTTTDPTTGVTSGPASGDAQTAHDLAHQMAALYAQALATSSTATNLPTAPVTTSGGGSTGGSTSSSGGTTVNVAAPSSTTRDLMVAAGVVAVGAGGWWWWKHKRGRR